MEMEDERFGRCPKIQFLIESTNIDQELFTLVVLLPPRLLRRGNPK